MVRKTSGAYKNVFALPSMGKWVRPLSLDQNYIDVNRNCYMQKAFLVLLKPSARVRNKALIVFSRFMYVTSFHVVRHLESVE